MRFFNKALFNMLCIMLLVFTTIAPSLAFASESSTIHTINIHAGSIDRKIEEVNGTILVQQGQNGNPVWMTSSSNGDGVDQLRFSTESIGTNNTYKLVYSIRYTEKEKTFTYYDERTITGDEILKMSDIELPTNENLSTTSVYPESGNRDYERIHFITMDSKQWKGNYKFNLTNGSLVSDNLHSLHYMISETKNDVKQFLIGNVAIGKPIDYDALLNDSSEVTFEGAIGEVSLSNMELEIGARLNPAENKKIQISNGTYNVNFNNDNNWYGELVIDGNQTIQIPTNPTNFEFSYLYANSSSELLNLNYGLNFKSGQFNMASSYANKDIKFEIYKGTEKIDEWYNSHLHSSFSLKTADWKNGSYTLKATYTLSDEHELVAEKEFNFNSGKQALKGTVFTAENAKGEPLTSGAVTLYAKTSRNGNTNYDYVISQPIQIAEDAYEAFIPDAYILDGIEYYVTVMDYATKTLYTKEIIGQEAKTYHFEKSSLTEIKLNANSFTTDSVNFKLLDEGNLSNRSVYFYGFGWHIATDETILADWVGTDENKSMYKWVGLLTEKNGFEMELENVKWQTLKPAAKYERAGLSIYGEKEIYPQLFVSEELVTNPSVFLMVNDGFATYRGYVPYSKEEEEQEIEFKSYDGYANINTWDRKTVYTNYHNDNGSLVIEGDVSFTYEITDESGKSVGEPIITSDFWSFQLDEPLAEGIYYVKLTESTVDKKIVSLSMNSTISIGEEQTALTLPLNVDTEYGKFHPQNAVIQINDPLDSNYYFTPNLYWNHEGNYFVVPEYFEIQPEKQYKVMLNGVFSDNLGVMDLQVISGKQLLNTNKTNPLQLSDELKSVKVTHNVDLSKTNSSELAFGLSGADHISFGPVSVHGKDSFQVLVSPNNYQGNIVLIDSSQNATILKIPETTITDNLEIAVDGTNLAKVSVKNGSSDMAISGLEYFPNRHRIHDENSWFNTVSQQKGSYDQLRYYIASKATNDTPWGYSVMLRNIELTEDKSFSFNEDEITGAISNLTFQKYEGGSNYLFADFSLRSGDFIINDIYRVLDRNQYMGVAEATEDPIRDYRGLFSGINQVPVAFKVKDQNGKTVWETTGSLYNRSFNIYKKLTEGTYTFEVHIPTALRKSLTLKKEFIVEGENAPFVQIHTPQDGLITNAESITVTGRANADALVTMELQKDGEKVENENIIANTDGEYTHTFKPSADGKYTIVATNGDAAKASVTLTIDRTAPVKAADVKFTKEAAGLKVTWTGAKDAVSYKVEVAENDNDFTVLSASQKETTATIPNIKPGVTYNVKITSADTAGNTSISDVASYTVDPFTATSISIEDNRNVDNLLSIGDKLTVKVEGSYESGFTAVANVHVDGTAEQVPLTYNETTKLYEGEFTVKEGHKVIDKVTGQILNGNEKTETISKKLAWSVGSTVKGIVTDGTPVENATIRLVSKKTYTPKTDVEGAFELKGLPEGTYKVSVAVNGKTYAQKDLVVGQSKIETADFKIPTLTDMTITIVDKGTANPTIDGLSARFTGPKGFVVFGTTMGGKFTTNDGKTTLKDLETGDYKLTVYGQGAYQTTTVPVTLVKGTSAYQVEVNKLTIDEKTLTIKVNGDIEKIDSLSLFSYSTYQRHGYTGVGSYYLYNVKPENGVIEIKVAAADDYTLDIYTEGFMSVQQHVDLTSDTEIEITLEQGRVVTGKVVDGQGEPVANAYVYAYSGGTYSSTVSDKDGMYKLIGLSKTDDVTIDVSSQLYLSYHETIDKGTEELKKDIQLAKAAMMTGKVVDKDGHPVANVSISAEGDNYSYGWSRTAADGTFAVTGLKDTGKYKLSFYSFGYPTVLIEGKQPSDIGTVTLQAIGDGNFAGEGNYLAASKASVVSGEEVQFTLAYRNNGAVKAEDVPVTLTIPAGLQLISETIALNGKVVKSEGNRLTIPSVPAGESGKITFSAKVGNVETPSLTVNAKVAENGSILTASTSVVFVTLEAPALTGEKKIKVYGNAKIGSTVELFAGNKKVGETKVDGKWWFIDVELPVADTATKEKFTLSAKVKDGEQSTMSKPITVTYQPDVPKMTDVTVHAGWNGNVKLNPYTGVATFAIVEHTPLDTTIKFDKDVESATISFLGKKHELVKGADNTFTFDGQKLGKWTSYGEQLLEITFKKGDVEITVPLMNIIVLIDPSGYVFEGSMDNKLEGVRAVVETNIGTDENKEWVQWDAAKFGQVNPQITDEDGRYGWDVLAGEWRVIFTKDGYEPYISRIMNVPPPETELNVPMVRNTDPVIVTTEVTEKDLTVEFDRLMNTANKETFIQLFEGDSDTPIQGTVKTVDAVGYKSINTPADKEDGHIGQDSNNEDGFFVVDETKILSKSLKFLPNTSLKADTTYRLVINGEIVDSAGLTLGAEKVFTFKTAQAATPGDGGNNGGTPPTGGGTGGGGGSVITPPTSPTPPVEPTPEKPVPLTPPVFKDITNTFAKNEINILAAKGIIQGKTETNFAPNAQITRAEFAVLLARALDLPMKDYEGKFGDVSASKKWAFAGVEAAARAGIVNGAKDGKFNPDAPIKREEIAAMVMRAIAYQDKTTLEGIVLPANFKDHGSIGAFAITAVYNATAIGVIKGNNGNFNPKDNATRAEAAVMLYRALDTLKLVD